MGKCQFKTLFIFISICGLENCHHIPEYLERECLLLKFSDDLQYSDDVSMSLL